MIKEEHTGTAEDATRSHCTSPKKAVYRAPTLVYLGAVKDLTKGGGSAIPDSRTGLRPLSDRRTKENIRRVGTHPLGFGLYLYHYKSAWRKSGQGQQFGVMADEVEQVMPEAVIMHTDGYKRVDYAMLGVEQSLS